MTSTPTSLPDDPQELRQLAEQMARQLAVYEQEASAKDERIEQLLDYIQLLRQKQFGAKADRLSKEQLSLFDEAELEALIGELEAELEAAQQEQDTPATTPTSPAKTTPKRKPLPAHLTRIERIIDLDDEQKATLGDGWVLIGYETA